MMCQLACQILQVCGMCQVLFVFEHLHVDLLSLLLSVVQQSTSRTTVSCFLRQPISEMLLEMIAMSVTVGQ